MLELPMDLATKESVYPRNVHIISTSHRRLHYWVSQVSKIHAKFHETQMQVVVEESLIDCNMFCVD